MRADPGFAPPNGESPGLSHRGLLQTFSDWSPDIRERPSCWSPTAASSAACWTAWLGAGDGNWVRGDPHNCSVTLLEWDGVAWHDLLVNDLSHLAPELMETTLPAYAQ